MVDHAPEPLVVNAVVHLISRMSPEAIRRLAALRDVRGAGPASTAMPRGALDVAEASARLVARWGGDLCALLNAMTRGELADLAAQIAVPTEGRAAELRTRLWDRGAALERGATSVSPAVQPRPIVLGGHLVIQAPPRGLFPPSARWPREVPPPAPAAPPPGEPETLDDLLAAADRVLGVRLGPRGRDKGAWGLRAAELLGIVERNDAEPDWRGDVEVKTLAVARDPSGWWRVVEDPAIAMLGEPALAKLSRTLWLARCDLDAADPGDERGDERGNERTGDRFDDRAGEFQTDATIVSWYLLDWDPDVARLARRDLHDRPKGPAGTTARALYLHKRFFADAGLLATLNGPGALDATAALATAAAPATAQEPA
jgi:hypothetical protein